MSDLLLVGGSGVLLISWILLLGCGGYGICRNWIGPDATAAGIAGGAVCRPEEPPAVRRTHREGSPAARRCRNDSASHVRIERHSFANYRGCLE